MNKISFCFGSFGGVFSCPHSLEKIMSEDEITVVQKRLHREIFFFFEGCKCIERGCAAIVEPPVT